MVLLQLFILILLLALLLNMHQNLKMLKEVEQFTLEAPLPLVSILVPARNEEKNIRNCISSLLKQDYPHLEVIVLDDNSRDRTYEIAKEMSLSSHRLKVIKGKKLPPDWNGKTWACQQLAQKARGEWLLFADADTVQEPGALAVALSAAQKNNSAFVTCLPGLIAETWSEKLFMPLIHFVFVVLVPFHIIHFSREARLSLGIGPFMLINREFYLSCGGHEVLKKDIVDDVGLARVVRKNGGKITVVDGTKFMSVRFYSNLREIWNGFSKNFYGGIGNAPHFLLAINLGCYFLFLYPYLSLWGALESHQSVTLPLVQVSVITMMKIILALRFNTSVFFGLLHPFTVIMALLILINSFRRSLFRKKFEWKERLYPID